MNIKNYCFFKSNIESIISDDVLVNKNIEVIVTIDNYEFSFIDKLSNDSSIRRYFMTLSNYPNMSDWELYQLYSFIKYENDYDRKVGIWCANINNIIIIENYLIQDTHLRPDIPNKLTACTACKHKGCMTEYVMHIASVEDSMSIFKMGKLLSASKVQNMIGDEEYINKRNAVGDPIDYSDYIMFGWANCQSGDRIVVERKIGHFPSNEEMEKYYEPSPRFYFRFSDIIKHQNATFDGHHPVKIRDELELSNNLYLCIIPDHIKKYFENTIDKRIKDKIIYVEYNGEDIWDWSKKIYDELLLYSKTIK